MASWKVIEINNETFIFKLITNETSESENIVECFLSDFKCLWKESLKMADIISRAERENPLIEYDKETILKAIHSPENCQFILNKVNSNDSVQLKVKSYISDVPFQYYWQLKQCQQDTFLDNIMKPLLIALVDAETQKSALIDIVKQKDIEIQQYKIEGATLSRKHVSTIPFEQIDFHGKFSRQSSIESNFIEVIKNDNYLSAIRKLCNIDTVPGVINGQCFTVNCENLSKDEMPITPRKTKKLLRESRIMRKFQVKAKVKLNYEKKNNQELSSPSSENDESNSSQHTGTSGSMGKKPKIMNKLNL